MAGSDGGVPAVLLNQDCRGDLKPEQLCSCVTMTEEEGQIAAIEARLRQSWQGRKGCGLY